MRSRLLQYTTAGFASILLTASCSLHPSFTSPATTQKLAEHEYINQPEKHEGTASMSLWWQRIDDATLNQQVKTLLADNLTLKQATWRIAQAQANRDIIFGDYLPSVSSTASATRARNTANTSRTLEAGISASWQIDLFGRTQSALKAANATYAATKYDNEAIKQSLVAELVQRRAALAILQHQLNLAKETTQNRQTLYTIVKRRYESGTSAVALSDVYLAENNFRAVQADQHQFEQAVQSEAYQLDLLLGQTPRHHNVASSPLPLLPQPLAVPLCLPANLLDRRPDLKASQLRAVAANADIGVAIAQLYPSLTLGASTVFSGTNSSNLFDSGSLLTSLLGSLTTQLFEGGSLRANIRLQEAEANELIANYSQNILNALREVETALSGEQQLRRQIVELRASVEALKAAETISEKRYLNGIISLQDFLETQRQRYQVEQNMLSTQQQYWNNRTALYLALGGDWFNDQQTPAKAQKCSKEPNA